MYYHLITRNFGSVKLRFNSFRFILKTVYFYTSKNEKKWIEIKLDVVRNFHFFSQERTNQKWENFKIEKFIKNENKKGKKVTKCKENGIFSEK